MSNEKSDEFDGRVTPELSEPLTLDSLLSDGLEVIEREKKEKAENRKRKREGRAPIVNGKTPDERRLETWIIGGIAQVFNQQTCKQCGEISTTVNSSKPMARRFDPRKPSDIWWSPVVGDINPELARESLVIEELVDSCIHCWDGEVKPHLLRQPTQPPVKNAPDTEEKKPEPKLDPSDKALEDLWRNDEE